MSALSAIDRLLSSVRRQVAALITRGEVSAVGSTGFAQISAASGETVDDVHVWQTYGLVSVPPVGSEALMVQLAAQSEDTIVIATESHDDKPNDLAEGDAALYGKVSAPGQASVRCLASGGVRITHASGQTVEIAGSTDFVLLASTLKTTLSALTPLANNPLCPEVATWCNALLSVLKAMPLSTKVKVS